MNSSRYALNSKKIESDRCWNPEISLEDGVRQMIEWCKDNSKWVSDVRVGEYVFYYERYHDDRENSLKAIADSGSKLPA